MTARAGDLLNIMSVRLHMQETGVTRPDESVARATKQLVERLQSLSREEEVAISYELSPFHARYIRVLTGEVLAEIAVNELPAT
jgi:hypothetical protein